ncbi:MAG: phosphoribosylformylglycinamidine synthase subunit PurS [Candidatus Marinimicrobia bacterium]|nr:phosphoribosylformylglycinamidine synthase subunit PurS [Candidatus Neomarinimicrobiota bacterium]
MAKVVVIVTVKEGILDPQAKAILHAMEGLDFKDCDSLISGKYFELNFPGLEGDAAIDKGSEAAKKILVNSNIETFKVELKG